MVHVWFDAARRTSESRPRASVSVWFDDLRMVWRRASDVRVASPAHARPAARSALAITHRHASPAPGRLGPAALSWLPLQRARGPHRPGGAGRRGLASAGRRGLASAGRRGRGGWLRQAGGDWIRGAFTKDAEGSAAEFQLHLRGWPLGRNGGPRGSPLACLQPFFWNFYDSDQGSGGGYDIRNCLPGFLASPTPCPRPLESVWLSRGAGYSTASARPHAALAARELRAAEYWR